jgi:hypothetical protein
MTQSVALRADRLRNNSAAVHKVAIATAAPVPENTSLVLSTYMGREYLARVCYKAY